MYERNRFNCCRQGKGFDGGLALKDIPDILGMKLVDAEALLEKEGLIFSVIETKPPRPPRVIYASSTLRVIKVNEIRHDNINSKCSKESKEVLVTVCNI